MLSKIWDNLKRKNFPSDIWFISNIAFRLNNDKNPNNDIDNRPSSSQELSIFPCLMSTADAAQEIHDLLFKEWSCRIRINSQEFKMIIHSAYRNEKLNKLAGGQKNSQHLQGLAIDFSCSAFGSPEEIVKFLYRKKFIADQCFVEGSWVHYSRLLKGIGEKKQSNRMMYGYYLINKLTKKREFKPL